MIEMTGVNRFFIELSFKGTNYHGWQVQPNATTVQQIVDNALSIVLHEKIDTTGAGRTDAGVHASYFTAHFDYSKKDFNTDTKTVVRSLNAVLPEDIAVLNVYPVRSDIHARFSALSRTYKYTFLKKKNPFLNDYGWLYPFKLDIELLNKVSAILLDFTDFSSFSKHHAGSLTNNCKIYYVNWQENKDIVTFTIKADRFLRNMVRAIVGTLIDIARHKSDVKTFEDVILKKDRSFAGMSVPARGLELTCIEYPVNTFTSLVD